MTSNYQEAVLHRAAVCAVGVMVTSLVLAVGSFAAPRAVQAASCNHEDYPEFVFPVTNFGANGNDMEDDREATRAALDCIKSVSATAPRNAMFTLYFEPGFYRFNDRLEYKAPLSKVSQILNISGAGPGVTEVLTGVTASEGVFKLVTNHHDQSIFVHDMSFAPQNKNAGTALTLLHRDGGKRFVPSSRSIVRDVSIHDREVVKTRNAFSKGIVIEGAQNPLIDNVKISNWYGPKQSAAKDWYSYDTSLTLRNTYAPTVLSSKFWGGKIGILINNDSTTRDPGPIGPVLNGVVTVKDIQGVVLRSNVPEPSITIINTHLNNPKSAISISGSWQLHASNNLFYYFYNDGEYKDSFTNFILNPQVRAVKVENTIFHTPALTNDAAITMFELNRAPQVQFSNNIINQPDAVVFGQKPSGGVTATGNIYLRNSKEYQTTTEAPALTVTAFSRNETVVPGETIELTWDDTAMDQAAAYYVNLVNEIANVKLTDQGQRGTYTWQIPADFQPGQYRLQICRRGTVKEGRCNRSDGSLTVVSPFVTVTSPNGGEAYSRGKMVTINWDDTAMDQAAAYYVSVNGTGVTNQNLTELGLNGTYSWKISNSIPPGNYSIRVCRRGAQELTAAFPKGRCDQSDARFTVK